MISPDTKAPDSTSDIVSAVPPATRELLLPCQDRGRFPKTDRLRAVFSVFESVKRGAEGEKDLGAA